MPLYRIKMTNSEFESAEEGEYPSVAAATKMAISAATRVVAENIANGEQTSAVEVCVEEGDRVVAHHVVNLSVSQLLPTD
jgi:hypothetical protein